MIAPALVVAATLGALATCVLVQYEGLLFVWRRISAHRGHRRVRVLYAIVSIIALHVVEVTIFGLALWALLQWPQTGSLQGTLEATFLDCLYFSAITFSTVGFGDVAPLGAIRFFAAGEALAGFVLIAWSASFTYLEMERFWRPEDMDRRRDL